MKKAYLSFIVLAVTVGFVLGNISMVCAQDEFVLEEITVTAQKTEENLQDTAMSIDVITGTEIRDIGGVNLFDMLRNVTNLQLTETGAAGPTISIRGLGHDFPPQLGEPAVSMNFDGAVQMDTAVTEFGNFDIDRIEVLRGPQGTLYGRNSTGGVVNIISTKPQMGVTEGYVNFDLGDYQKMKGAAAINIPLSDHFAGRLATLYSRQDSYLKLSDGWRDRQEGWAARMQLRYEPTDEAYVNLLTTYTTRTGGYLGGRVAWDNWRAGIIVNTQDNPLQVRTSLSRRETIRAVLDAEFPLGPGIVTLVPTYDHRIRRSASLSTDRRSGELDLSQGVNVGAALPQETYSIEARYSSKPDSRVTWLGGIFYAKDDHPSRTWGANPVDVIGWYTYKAAFGQITYPFSDTFRLVTGLRREQDEKYRESVAYTPTVKDTKYSYFDWKLGVEKDLRDDFMAYFTLATGHRTGGYDREGTEFDTESSISGELGMKSRWLNGRLQLNADVFYYDYSDYQVTDNWEQYDVDQGRIVRIEKFFNCDKAINFGSEIEVDLLIGESTQLNASIAYLNATYQADFFPHLTADITSTVSQNGADLPHSPDFTIIAGIDHMFMLSSGATLTPRVSAKYTGGQFIGVLPTSDFYQDATAVVDYYLNFQSTWNWSLNFYATNIFDKVYATGIGGRDAYFPGYPRMVGCTFDIRF